MKFCQPHWDKLREGVRERGLYHLVAKDGEAATGRVMAELQGTATDKTYDPLMAAHWMIFNRALEAGGIGLMGHNPNDPEGHYCPLCELGRALGPDAETNWINGCLDSVLEFCREKGLVTSA